jgi:hypothetical protein
MTRLPRWVAKFIARLTRRFWLPCPKCGAMFSGHEVDGIVQCEHTPGGGHAVCCGGGMDQFNPEACARAHSPHESGCGCHRAARGEACHVVREA